MLSAHVDSDNAIYCVPVEVKKTVEKRDMAQLAEYQAALSCGVIKRYLLLDEHRALFVFSPLSYSDGVPVPIMLVSPVMNWRQGPVLFWESGILANIHVHRFRPSRRNTTRSTLEGQLFVTLVCDLRLVRNFADVYCMYNTVCVLSACVHHTCCIHVLYVPVILAQLTLTAEAWVFS